MKLIQRLTLLSSIALLAVACDLQQTFDERINDKQLLVLAPDFADTSVQLVFRDPETLAVIDEDFEVTVYSNKRLVDLNGNYKNEFIARGGVMEFSVSPEEMVSESDPLHIGVVGLSTDKLMRIPLTETSFNTKGLHSALILPISAPSLDQIVNSLDSSPQGKRIENNELLQTSAQDLELKVFFNGSTPKNKWFSISVDGQEIYEVEEFFYPRDNLSNGVYAREYLTDHAFEPIFLNEPKLMRQGKRLKDDLEISIAGTGLSVLNYTLTVGYVNLDNDRIFYEINKGGNYTLYVNDYVGFTDEWMSPSKEFTGIIPNFMNRFTLPEGTYFGLVALKYWDNSNYKACKGGFNLRFEGISGADDLNLLYKATRNTDDKIFAIASFNVSSASNQYNSLQDGGNNQHIIAVEGNKLEFAENSQYIIEPSVIELGGEELCGNTYTVTLKRRDTHKMHNINLSMRNENQNVGVALTFSALLRKQGQSDAAWETINFKQGSTSVYLEEGSTYEVKLTLADEPFEFTFTNDLSLVEAAVQATKRNVSRIKDITYTIEQTADSNTIDAEIVFFEGQSLID